MSPKHTPGPWIAARMLNEIGAGLEVCAGDGTRQLIATPAFGPGHAANARLIAAAPCLLDALEQIAKAADMHDVTRIARAALAKARGE